MSPFLMALMNLIRCLGSLRCVPPLNMICDGKSKSFFDEIEDVSGKTADGSSGTKSRNERI